MADGSGARGARIAAPARPWVARPGVTRYLAYRPVDAAPSAEAVREAVRTANGLSAQRHGVDAARGDIVVAVGREVHLRVAVGGDGDTRVAWLEDVAAALSGGELTRPYDDRGPESALQELLTLRTVTAFVGQRPDGGTDRLTSALLDGFDTGATAYFSDAEAGMAVDPGDLALLFGASDFAPEVTWVRDGRVHGNVARSGAAASRYARRTSWRDELSSARQVLVRAAPHLDVAFVRATSAYTRWGDVHLYPPAWPSGHEGLRYVLGSEWWSHRVPDAHALQLLTADHLDRADDLGSWDVVAIGDRFLVSAPDPAPWFEADQPDPATLDRARRDFGSMIVTPAELTGRA